MLDASVQTGSALPVNADSVFPLNTSLIDAEGLPATCKEALLQFREALEAGLVRVRRKEVAQGLEIATVDRFGLSFSALLCLRTGLIYTSPQLVEEDLPLYYDRFYHRLHLARPVAELEGLFQGDDRQGESIWRRVAPHLKIGVDGLSVLEIGAGVGNVLAGFRKYALAADVEVDLMGTEFSRECLEAADKRGIPMIQGGFVEAVALHRHFDVVILSHVFEHIVDLDSALRDLRQLLNPGGMVYIEVPGVLSIHRRLVYRFDWVSYFTHAHIYHFCLATLGDLLNDYGFHLVSGNEEVEALFRFADSSTPTTTLRDSPETAAFVKGYLAMLASERDWNSSSPDSPLKRIDDLTEELTRSRAALAYYDRKRKSLWWLIRQMARTALPWLADYLDRLKK